MPSNAGKKKKKKSGMRYDRLLTIFSNQPFIIYTYLYKPNANVLQQISLHKN